MAIFVPTKINVGFQGRGDTYSGKLAYVIYFDQNGKLRKENSWQNWRHKDIPNEIYDNEPLEGFVLNKKVGGVKDSYYNVRETYVRVYDPRGFEFEITIPNLLWILQNCDCMKGKGLEGQFVYGWDGKELVLVPVESPDYREIAEKNSVIHNNTFVKPKELVVGSTYEDLDGQKYVYMGKFKPWTQKCNYYHNTSLWDRREEGYEKPLDDTWKRSVLDESYGHQTYYKWVQKEQAEFFFIHLGNPESEYEWKRKNSVIYMKTVNKKFTRAVADSTENHSEYVELLACCENFSPVDYDSGKIISLPYENFEAAAIQFIENHRKFSTFRFGVVQNGSLVSKNVDYDDDKSQFYIRYYITEPCEIVRFGRTVTDTKETMKLKYYGSIQEMYADIKPVYGVEYLANGSEYRRSHYYGTEK